MKMNEQLFQIRGFPFWIWSAKRKQEDLNFFFGEGYGLNYRRMIRVE